MHTKLCSWYTRAARVCVVVCRCAACGTVRKGGAGRIGAFGIAHLLEEAGRMRIPRLTHPYWSNWFLVCPDAQGFDALSQEKDPYDNQHDTNEESGFKENPR